MRAKKKIDLIQKIIDRYDEGCCFYCGGVLNGDLEGDMFNEVEGNDYCNYCGHSIDVEDDWAESCMIAIEKVINEERFKP